MTGLDAALWHLTAALATAVPPSAAKSGSPDKGGGDGAFPGGAPGFAGHLACCLEEDRKTKDEASQTGAALAHPWAPAARKALLTTKTAIFQKSTASETVQACSRLGPDCFPSVCAPDLTGVTPHISSSGTSGAEASCGPAGHDSAACRETKGGPQFERSGQAAGRMAADGLSSGPQDKPYEMICRPQAVRQGAAGALTSLVLLPEDFTGPGPVRGWDRRLAPDNLAGSKGGAPGAEQMAVAVPFGAVRKGSPRAGVSADDVRNDARRAPQVQETNVLQGQRNRAISSAASAINRHSAEGGGLGIAVIKQETHHVLAPSLVARHATQSPSLSNPVSGRPSASCRGGTASRALAPLPAMLLGSGSASGKQNALRSEETPCERGFPLVSELAKLWDNKGGAPAAQESGQLWDFAHASPPGKTDEGSTRRVLDAAGLASANERTDPARISIVSALERCKALRRETVIPGEAQQPGIEQRIASHVMPAAPLCGLPPRLPSGGPGRHEILVPHPTISAESVNRRPPGASGRDARAPAASELSAARDSPTASDFPRPSLESLALPSSLRQNIPASLPMQARSRRAYPTPSLGAPLLAAEARLNLADSAVARRSVPLVIVANRFGFPDSIEPNGAQQPLTGMASASRALRPSAFPRPDMAPRIPAEEEFDPLFVPKSGTEAANVSSDSLSQPSAAASGRSEILRPARATRPSLADQQLNSTGTPSPAKQIADFVVHSASEQISGTSRGDVSTRPASGALGAVAADSSPAPLRILQLQLDPPNLGRITVRLRLKEGKLDLRLDAERAEALRLIGQEKDLLARTLKSDGYIVDELVIRAAEPQASQLKTGVNSPSNSQEHSPAQAEGGQSGHNSHADRDDLHRPRYFAEDDAPESFCSHFSGGDHFL